MKSLALLFILNTLRHPTGTHSTGDGRDKVELAERRQVLLANNKLLEEQRLSQRTQFDLEMMNELGYCSGIENYSRYLSGRGPVKRLPRYLTIYRLMVC